MLIGFDFDNTIVNYKNAISKLSSSIPDLPDDLPRLKLPLRDYLRQVNREQEWTEFQGLIYGPGMKEAEPYEDAIKILHSLHLAGHQLVILSHRTRYPYAGPKYDLHSHAQSWIKEHLHPCGLFTSSSGPNSANFFETKSEKIKHIGFYECSAFLDDLPSILQDELFPSKTLPYLFDPDNKYAESGIHQATIVNSWPIFNSCLLA